MEIAGGKRWEGKEEPQGEVPGSKLDPVSAVTKVLTSPADKSPATQAEKSLADAFELIALPLRPLFWMLPASPRTTGSAIRSQARWPALQRRARGMDDAVSEGLTQAWSTGTKQY
jgi:hypothetical protein